MQQGVSSTFMKAFEYRLLHGYLLHGCLYTITNWRQIVRVKALQAIQLVDCVWTLEHEALAHVFKDWDIRVRDAVQ